VGAAAALLHRLEPRLPKQRTALAVTATKTVVRSASTIALSCDPAGSKRAVGALAAGSGTGATHGA
jgi:hypothetical protein